MSQAVWTGSITFGLVTIPVRLYPATEPKDVRFHLYDRRTGKRVRYERVTRADDAATFAPQSDDTDTDQPTIADSGVRSSCETTARNSSLRRLARSAARRASSAVRTAVVHLKVQRTSDASARRGRLDQTADELERAISGKTDNELSARPDARPRLWARIARETTGVGV